MALFAFFPIQYFCRTVNFVGRWNGHYKNYWDGYNKFYLRKTSPVSSIATPNLKMIQTEIKRKFPF